MPYKAGREIVYDNRITPILLQILLKGPAMKSCAIIHVNRMNIIRDDSYHRMLFLSKIQMFKILDNHRRMFYPNDKLSNEEANLYNPPT